MTSDILFYISWYLVVGYVSSWLINESIKYTNATKPYTAAEIAFAIVFWPINVCVFIYAFICSLFR